MNERAAPNAPPNDLYAEQSVIGSILLDNDQYAAVAAILSKNDFYQVRHRVLWRAIEKTIAQRMAVDILTIKSALESSGEFDDVGGFGYIVEIADAAPRISNCESYARIIRECAIRRELIRCGYRISEIGFEDSETPAEQSISEGLQMLSELSRRRDRRADLELIKEPANKAFEHIEALVNDPDAASGLATGFIDLDALTAGLQPGNLVIIAGRPSMGKTALAMNIAEYAALTGRAKVSIHSLEMSPGELATRSLSSLSGVDSSMIRSGRFGDGLESERNWENLAQALKRLEDAPIWIDGSSAIPPAEIAARARRLHAEEKLDLVIVDYLQLLQTGDDRDNRATELSNITREFKFLAANIEAPVILISQLNRQVEQRVDKRPRMSDLRDSGAIEQDADLIVFVYRDEMYHQDSVDHGTAELIVAKHRNGALGTVRLVFEGRCTRFQNLAKNVL